MGLYTIIRVYDIVAGSRIEATERMLEALDGHVERDFHIRDYIREPGEKAGRGRPVDLRPAAGWVTSCAGDSKKIGAWDQNLMTEWHIRYRGPGIMVYWHVEKKALCIYSQIKRCSSSEVASMIQGLLRHCTDMEVRKGFVDTHGQSFVGFAFTHLLGIALMPRFADIGGRKLYRPETDA